MNKPLDLGGVRTYPLAARKSKVGLSDFARPHVPGSPFSEFFARLPRLLAAESLRGLVADLRRAPSCGAWAPTC